MEIQIMKNCTVCKIDKPYENFHKSAKTSDGYTFRCKTCQSAYYKGYNASRKAANAKYVPDSKTCLQCRSEKPISQFGIRQNSPDKHNSYCKPCWRKRCYESMKRNGR